MKLSKSRKHSSCHFAFIGQPYLQPWESYEVARSNNQFPPRRKLLPDTGSPLLYVLSHFRKMACLHICKFNFAEPFIDVDFDLQHAFRSQFHALELILRVLISILGIQTFDMIRCSSRQSRKSPSRFPVADFLNSSGCSGECLDLAFNGGETLGEEKETLGSDPGDEQESPARQ